MDLLAYRYEHAIVEDPVGIDRAIISRDDAGATPTVRPRERFYSANEKGSAAVRGAFVL
jgi:hypothetical protein